ncbi:MAG TPA: hypothetical protein VNI20_04215, partial [Fimbriimonadaceae bacterium]|nr:hypothetical protein [Fimbriimonadaceae bacterium]
MPFAALLLFALTPGRAHSLQQAPIIEGTGSHTFPVTTTSKEAQKYFDQGLVLAYGFNHQEAHRSFLYAAQLDPKCAMAYWGAALVLGPNLNAGMPKSANQEAHDLAQKALDNLDDESPVEQALVRAVQARYSGANRSDADQAYANAMRKVAEQFPDDPDVLALTAESLMDLHPWDFYKADKSPQPWTKEITDMLDRSLKIDPSNPATNHFIIHAWEASADPDHATPYADRLRFLVPGVSHLAHMPSHIYLRVGRYHEATECNLRAAKAYDDYAATCEKAGLKPIGGYKMHNW